MTLLHIKRLRGGHYAWVPFTIHNNRLGEPVSAAAFVILGAGDNTQIPNGAVFRVAVNVLDNVVKRVTLYKVPSDETVELIHGSADIDEGATVLSCDLRPGLAEIIKPGP